MKNDNIHISIILPVYNSETFIAQTLVELDEFLSGLPFKAELIVVDDGSKDRSFVIVSDWAKKQKSYAVHVLRNSENRGKGGAVAAGMLHAKGEYRIFLDADLAYPPRQILRILNTLEQGSDVAVACRIHRDSRYTISPTFFHYLYTRHIASRVINWFMRKTIIPHCRDSQAGLKGFRAKAAEAIFSRQLVRGFPFDIEVLYLAVKMRFKIREVAVEYQYLSEPTTVVFLRDAMGMLRDVLRVRLNYFLGRYKLLTGDGGKRLIINADDYGMTLPISRGIMRAVSTGSVGSISVMANSPSFDKAMDEIVASRTRPDIGFHATLTWGKPLLDPNDVPTIVDEKGSFLSKSALFKRTLMGRVSEEDVYRELCAQCDRLAGRWPDISHMDGHHHVHVFPVIRSAAERVAREYGIRFIRSPREGFWSRWHRAALRRCFISSLSASHPSYWSCRGFLSTDHFGGFSLGAAHNLRKRWIETLNRLPKGVSEIMVHPGFGSENCDGYNFEREEEVKILGEPAFLEAATKAGVKLISFQELASSS